MGIDFKDTFFFQSKCSSEKVHIFVYSYERRQNSIVFHYWFSWIQIVGFFRSLLIVCGGKFEWNWKFWITNIFGVTHILFFLKRDLKKEVFPKINIELEVNIIFAWIKSKHTNHKNATSSAKWRFYYQKFWANLSYWLKKTEARVVWYENSPIRNTYWNELYHTLSILYGAGHTSNENTFLCWWSYWSQRFWVGPKTVHCLLKHLCILPCSTLEGG